MSLRERNKGKRRAQIIDAARSLFLVQGYSNTPLEEIAESAEVGIATLYNHFNNKNGLLAAIFEEEFDRLYELGDKLVASERTTPLKDVLALIDVYYQLANHWESSEMLRKILGPGLTETSEFDPIVVKAEQQVKAQIKAILLAHQKLESIRKNINIDDATMLVFYIFNQNYIEHVTHQWSSFTEMKRTMDRLVGFFIESICSETPKRTRLKRKH